jgi:hypothetical protein
MILSVVRRDGRDARDGIGIPYIPDLDVWQWAGKGGLP